MLQNETMEYETKEVSVCRACLNTDAINYISLFETYKNYFIFDFINSITNIQIKRDDGLPGKICSSCFLELKSAINFKQKCEDSNVRLQTSSFYATELDLGTHGILIKKEEPYSTEYVDENYDCFNCSEVNVDIKPEKLLEERKNCKSRAIDLKLVCHDCGQLFKSKCKLRVHWKKAHMVQSLICQYCKRQFKSFKAFHKHKSNKTKSCTASVLVNIKGEGKLRRFYCKDCDYNTHRMKDIMSHLVTHNGAKPYKCDLCSSAFTQQSGLDGHKENVHKKWKVEITCQFCGKYVKGRSRVYKHLKSHQDIKVQCDICKKFLKGKQYLIEHLKRHNGVKSYTCEKCAHSFYSAAELYNHKRNVHMKGHFWYFCDLCEYMTVKSSNIKKHKARHATGKMPCTVCGMFFENNEKLVLHQRIHFEEKKYGCPQCDKKFFRRDSMSKHVRQKHKTKMLLQEKVKALSVTKDDNPVKIQRSEDMVEVEIIELTE